MQPKPKFSLGEQVFICGIKGETREFKRWIRSYKFIDGKGYFYKVSTFDNSINPGFDYHERFIRHDNSIDKNLPSDFKIGDEVLRLDDSKKYKIIGIFPGGKEFCIYHIYPLNPDVKSDLLVDEKLACMVTRESLTNAQ
jgi:hypothetical protein